ncbi:MAG: hypothetical protein JSV59_04505 [Flavobacteriaceae bacterium]|nr:MAG: hypothetical protein JSV59_04505 [Flavobacteriaceae bacterium]
MTRKLSFKIVLKRLLLALGILLLLGLTLGIIYQKEVKEWILDEIQLYVSEIQSGDLEIEEIELTLFHNLPDVSVRLKNVNYYEHKDALRTAGERPILSAETLNLSFEPWPLIRNQNLIVSSVSMVHGSINFIEYEDKKLNLEKALENPISLPKNPTVKDTIVPIKPQKAKTAMPGTKRPEQITKSEVTPNSLEIDLKEIELRDMAFTYQNRSEEESILVDLTLLNGNISLNSKGISCNLSSDFQIMENTSLPMVTELGPTSLELQLDFIEADQKILVNNGYLEVEGFIIDLKGSYDHKKGKDIDLEFNASANDFEVLSRLLQEEVLKHNEASLQKADIIIKGRLYGQMEHNPPIIDLDFGVKDLSFKVPDGVGTFKNIGFTGEFHSGEMADYSKAMLSVRDLKGQMPGGSVSGNFLLKNFLQPYLKYDVNALVLLDGFDDIFQFPKIDSLRGKIKLEAEFDGLLNLQNEHSMDSLSRWSLNLENIGFKFIPTDKTINSLSGDIAEEGNTVHLKKLGLYYENSDVTLDGQLKNLYHFIFNKEQELEADLELRSSKLFTKHFIPDPETAPLVDDRISNLFADVRVSGGENKSLETYLPFIGIQLNHLSFEMDKLPGIQNVQGMLELYETQKGLLIDVSEMHAELPIGSADLTGNLVISDNAELLDITADLVIDTIPIQYILDLIYEMNDLELLNSKTMNQGEMILVNGDLKLSGTMETKPFALQKATITNSDISLRKPDSVLYESKKINLELKGLYFLHEEGSNEIVGFQTTEGSLNIDRINTPIFKFTPITLHFTALNDVFNINFSNLRKVKNLDDGSLLLDLSEEPSRFELNYNIKDIPIESVIKKYNSNKFMDGMLNASIQLGGTLADWDEMNKTIKGTLRFSGDTLRLYGMDIDDLLKKYKRSQKFNLMDVGAFVLAGPMGAVVTKGGDFGSLLSANLKEDDTTVVSRALANWKISDGILETEDVAFSTLANRLAFDGKFDFANDSIPGFTAYVIDKNGCSLMEQNISGKVDSLEVSKLRIAKTLLGSVINFINSVVGVKCEPVYQGAVHHPLPIKKSN